MCHPFGINQPGSQRPVPSTGRKKLDRKKPVAWKNRKRERVGVRNQQLARGKSCAASRWRRDSSYLPADDYIRCTWRIGLQSRVDSWKLDLFLSGTFRGFDCNFSPRNEFPLPPPPSPAPLARAAFPYRSSSSCLALVRRGSCAR